MTKHNRWVRAGAALVLSTALLAGCTANSAVTGPTSADLTPGGTAYPLPSSFAAVSPTISTPSPFSPSPSTPSSAPSKTTKPVTANPSVTTPKTTTSRTKPRAPTKVILPTVDTGGLSAAEIADRAALQKLWTNYWNVTDRILATPKSQREALLKTVAAPTLVQKILGRIVSYEKNGWDNYGSVVHHPYWGPPVDGKNVAIMGDCLDTSKAGRKVVKTGQLLTGGVKGDNTRISFTRLPGKPWLVFGVEFLNDQEC